MRLHPFRHPVLFLSLVWELKVDELESFEVTACLFISLDYLSSFHFDGRTILVNIL